MTIPPNPAPPPKSSGGLAVWIIIGAVVLVIAGLGCCGGIVTCSYLSHKSSAEQTGKVRTPPPDIEKITDAPTGSPQAKVPDNFPPDVPLYAGMVPVASFSNATNDSGSVAFTSADSADDVTSFYEKEMAIKGWKTESSVNNSGASMQTFSKSGREISVTIAPDHVRKTSVAIIYTGQ